MFKFQKDCLTHYFDGKNGLLNAPTGSGKTYALGIPMMLADKLKGDYKSGLKVLWITPLKALSVDITNALQEAADDLETGWRVERRSGDISAAKKASQLKNSPDCMVTTPESLHIMLARKGYSSFFKYLDAVIVDEWHELLSSKRGVQVELGLSRLKAIRPNLKVWGISATIGNMQEAINVLMGDEKTLANTAVVQANIKKKLKIHTLLPTKMEDMPWAGHLGVRMLKKVLPIIEENSSTLIFTNTRSQAEIWYQKIIDKFPDLAGLVALHHGSLGKEVREWVESALHKGSLKAVVSTSSLDLGVDFRPVSAVIQIGSPKGIARFLQRAGRSGHSPNATSKIYFLPTNSLEIIESSAIQRAIKEGHIESRIPVVRAFDVLVQYLVTLAVSDGFREEEIYQEVIRTHCYNSITREEWEWILRFITVGGDSLQSYEDFNKVKVNNGLYQVESRKIAMRHRLSMGTIVGDTTMIVKRHRGKKLGTIEEYFISRLNIGDAFIFAGQKFELVRVNGLTAHVVPSTKKSAAVPSWAGGRMSLSSEIAAMLRKEFYHLTKVEGLNREGEKLQSLLTIQDSRSVVPQPSELLIEYLEDDDGHHVFIYPFEGRMVHEGMALLLAYRLSKMTKISLNLGMNDYGFEILCDQEIPLMEALEEDWFTTKGLLDDIQNSSNMTALAGKKFREIAAISGLTFRGFPNKLTKERHLQSHSQLFFDVFRDYEPHNLLLQQAYEEVTYYQLEVNRIHKALTRIASQEIIVKVLHKPSPLCFPLLVDSLSRDRISNESVSDRVKRMLEAD
ncbi:MAG: DNA ligase-associated DEXH box helicase [Bacteroidetes bacterium]|nr:MAG: DNA ligase-associated DEXH box helicase [Bacteroidota bacterium]